MEAIVPILGAALTIGGAAMNVSSQSQAADIEQQSSKVEAQQMQVNAGQERAAAQRSAMEQRRQARLVQSRQQAVAAASGAGATDPTVVDLMTDTNAEGEYRALSELYTGEQRARGLETDAANTRYAGKVRAQQYRSRILPTILDTGATLLSRYG